MPKRIIISDTSSLIALNNIDELGILQQVYGQIIITPEIKQEYGLDLPKWIQVEKVKDDAKTRLLSLDLDLGEASGIALALENESSLLILDEKKGRKIAKKLGLSYTGILGVIIIAKEKGLITTVKSIIEKLEKSGFRMSEKLKAQVLKRVGE